MRIVLVGAVESTAAVLAGLLAVGRTPLAIVTLPLSKAGRHSDFVDLRPAAVAANVRVIDAENGNSPEVLAEIRSLEPELVLVIGWSQICRREFLEIPKLGCIGTHPSLLPANRGRGVLPWTILQGGDKTGGSLFWLADGVDTGDLLVQREFALAEDETARSLMDKHLAVLPGMVEEALTLIESGAPARQPQSDEGASWCAKRTAEDGWIDWNKSAREVWTLIRAVGKPYPGAFTAYDGRRLTVWAADLVLGAAFWGLPGQIQEVSSEGVLVQCGDREHVRLTRVEFASMAECAAVDAGLKLHKKLGVSPVPKFEEQ
jgi:methionyl-tRNA formyltransferase